MVTFTITRAFGSSAATGPTGFTGSLSLGVDCRSIPRRSTATGHSLTVCFAATTAPGGTAVVTFA